MSVQELRDKNVIRGLLQEIGTLAAGIKTPLKIMEVCGTHTMAIYRYGLKKLLLENGIEMLSGPGCPVCITPNEIHAAAIKLVTENNNFILTTFGDMTRVPTQSGSLQTIVPAPGSQVKVVYSPEESLEIARQDPGQEIMFFGVGFETTIPSIAATVKQAAVEKINNFSVLSAFWLVPPPLHALLESDEILIQGFLYPGHVSAIIGEEPYRFIPEKYGIPGAIAGFEPGEILLAISSILQQTIAKKAAVINRYTRVVRPEGNPHAVALMNDMLDLKDSHWRGLGLIPKSGLRLNPEYAQYDAEIKFNLNIEGGSGDLPGCRCGEILQAKIKPEECPLYGNKCTPNSPYGPCMVSFEGACLAYFKYGSTG